MYVYFKIFAFLRNVNIYCISLPNNIFVQVIFKYHKNKKSTSSSERWIPIKYILYVLYVQYSTLKYLSYKYSVFETKVNFEDRFLNARYDSCCTNSKHGAIMPSHFNNNITLPLGLTIDVKLGLLLSSCAF